MKVTLNHIASIQTGIFAKTEKTGEIVYLQSRHFDENGRIKQLLYPDLKSDDITEKHLLRHGDVLFAAKGTKNFAAWYENKNQPAVASTSFFVIRMQESLHNKVLPEYLVWFINHPKSQNFLKGKAIGTSIVSISKSALEELEIFIPDLETQRKVLKIAELRYTEIKLKEKIEALRERQIQETLWVGSRKLGDRRPKDGVTPKTPGSSFELKSPNS